MFDVADDGRKALSQTTRTGAGDEPASVRAPIPQVTPGSPRRDRRRGRTARAIAVQVIAMVCLGWTAAVLIAAGVPDHVMPYRPATEQERQQHDRDRLLEEMLRIRQHESVEPPAGAVTLPAPGPVHVQPIGDATDNSSSLNERILRQRR